MSYSKQGGYSPAMRSQFERERADAERADKEHEDAKVRARKEYLAMLQRQRDERDADNERQIEDSIAPDRERLLRQWLVDHPDHTEADFNRAAWPHLRQTVLEQRGEAAIAAASASLVASGIRYSRF